VTGGFPWDDQGTVKIPITLNIGLTILTWRGLRMRNGVSVEG